MIACNKSIANVLTEKCKHMELANGAVCCVECVSVTTRVGVAGIIVALLCWRTSGQ